VSWTICTYVWDTDECVRGEMRGLGEVLVELVVPEGCEEVMLELETRGGQVAGWGGLMEVANVCKEIGIERRVGRGLLYDEELSVEYSWRGRVENDEARVRWNLTERDVDVEYRTIRLCWRTGEEKKGISALRSIGVHEPGWTEDQGSKTTGMDDLKTKIKTLLQHYAPRKDLVAKTCHPDTTHWSRPRVQPYTWS
jgi:hypothetical protein